MLFFTKNAVIFSIFNIFAPKFNFSDNVLLRKNKYKSVRSKKNDLFERPKS